MVPYQGSLSKTLSTMIDELQIRVMQDGEAAIITEAFCAIGWNKPAALFHRYLAEQASTSRSCWVANLQSTFAGYVTVNWKPSYPVFVEQKIPEIQDLNVLPSFRRRGIGTALLDCAEAEIALVSGVAGIGVGLHPGYNAAQRLYGQRGYIPDGRGITYKDRYLREGETVILDDDLQLHLLKCLRP
jgi:GNAT superfamily N-acetyltransferase